MGATLEDLFEALGALGEDGPLQATSLRLPKALHDTLTGSCSLLLTAGTTHTLVATFSGDATYAPAVSAPVALQT